VPESSAGSNSQSGKIQDETNAPLGLAAEKNECGPCKFAAVQRSEYEMSAMETPSFEYTEDGERYLVMSWQDVCFIEEESHA
jgi:hypothetical protein